MIRRRLRGKTTWFIACSIFLTAEALAKEVVLLEIGVVAGFFPLKKSRGAGTPASLPASGRPAPDLAGRCRLEGGVPVLR